MNVPKTKKTCCHWFSILMFWLNVEYTCCYFFLSHPLSNFLGTKHNLTLFLLFFLIYPSSFFLLEKNICVNLFFKKLLNEIK